MSTSVNIQYVVKAGRHNKRPKRKHRCLPSFKGIDVGKPFCVCLKTCIERAHHEIMRNNN